MKVNEKGLDLCCQQHDIDWAKVAQSGVKFIIPRTGWGTDCDGDGIDYKFVENVKGALKNGITVGDCYHMVYAINLDEIRKNAQCAIDAVIKAGLPKSTVIWCDIEGDTIAKAAERGVTLSNKELRKFAETFCDYCLQAGYPTGIYLNADFLIYRYGQDIADKYDIWFADPDMIFSYPCLIKQNDWFARIPGITVNVDTDVWMGTYTAGTAKPKQKEEAKVGLVDKFCDALQAISDQCIPYYGEGHGGIGCSDYVCKALRQAGIIGENESFWAGQGQRGVLEDKSRFQKLPWNPSSLRKGDILYSDGNHVAVWDGGNGVWEGSPVHSHGVCDNGKTGIGRRKNHTYWNCGNGTNTWDNIYRIIDPNDVKEDAKGEIKMDKAFNASTLAKYLPVISKGIKGDMVVALQTIMKKYGWYDDTIDGMAGKNTVAGIKLMQTALNVPVDGYFGQMSWTALLSI